MSFLAGLFGLGGRTAMVTGGNSAIGSAMALALGQAGARVILVGRDVDRLSAAFALLADQGVDTEWIAADLGDRAEVARVVDRHRDVDILVNAAGINPRPHLDDQTVEQWDEIIAVNLTAPFLLGQAYGPAMAARGWGRIINIASQQSFRAFGNSGGYGAAKAGLVGLTRSQAEAWSPRGVTCNAVAPGLVRSAMTAPVFADPDKVEIHRRRTMNGQNGEPSDFAGVAVYLASDAAATVTGQTLFVDGGYSAT